MTLADEQIGPHSKAIDNHSRSIFEPCCSARCACCACCAAGLSPVKSSTSSCCFACSADPEPFGGRVFSRAHSCGSSWNRCCRLLCACSVFADDFKPHFAILTLLGCTVEDSSMIVAATAAHSEDATTDDSQPNPDCCDDMERCSPNKTTNNTTHICVICMLTSSSHCPTQVHKHLTCTITLASSDVILVIFDNVVKWRMCTKRFRFHH